MSEREPDSCYLCEIGKEGLFLRHPSEDMTILVCLECALAAIYAHPKLAIFKELQRA